MNIYQQWIYNLSFIPLLWIAMGLVFNTICFVIFRFTPEFRKMSSMVFLSFVVIIDTFSLFNWNFKKFTIPRYGWEIEYLSIFTCKVFAFFQYYLLQASAFLLCFVSIDRFITIRTTPGSFFSKLPFGTVKSAYAWAGGIMTCLFIFNFHILILNGYYPDPEQRNRTVNGSNGTYIEEYTYHYSSLVCNVYKTTGFRLFPVWDQIHLFLYNFIPGAIMLLFNLLLIYTTLIPSKKDKHKKLSASDIKAAKKKRNLTLSLLVVTFAFIVLTFPSTIGYGYFSDYLFSTDFGPLLLYCLDYLSFFNHVSIFFFTFMTHRKFRKIVVYQASRIFCFMNKDLVARLRAGADGSPTSQSGVSTKTRAMSRVTS